MTEFRENQCHLLENAQQYFDTNLEDVCRRFDLTPTHDDSLIVAGALALRERADNPNVVLVTGDTGMRLRARRVGLAVAAMPEAHRLPPALDAEEQERRDVERKLEKIQSRRPSLLVQWQGDQRVLKPTLEPVTLWDDAEIEAKIRDRLERIGTPKRTHTILGNEVKNPSYEADVEKVKDYAERLRNYLERRRSVEQLHSLSVACIVAIDNKGMMPATDVRLALMFPEFVMLWEALPELPTGPAAPSISGKPMQLLGLPSLKITPPPLPKIPAVRNTSFSISHDERIVYLTVAKLMQTYREMLKTFWFTFPTAAEVRPFHVDFHLVADELLEASEDRLTVVPQTEPSTA